jgi:hypothetical protein
LACDSEIVPQRAQTLPNASSSASHACLPIVTPNPPHLTRGLATIETATQIFGIRHHKDFDALKQ